MNTDIHQEIRGFVEARMPGLELADDEDIFSLSFVNSLFAMELVLFIEKTFGLQIPNEEIDMNNFRTVGAMVGLVDRLTHPAVNIARAS